MGGAGVQAARRLGAGGAVRFVGGAGVQAARSLGAGGGVEWGVDGECRRVIAWAGVGFVG